MGQRMLVGFALGLAALLALPLGGCRDSASDETTTNGSPTAATDSLPSALFVTSAPKGVVPLIEVKQNAKPGDQVTFEARVGGRRDAFVANRAVFFVADSSLLSCDQLHGDSCKTPWDYCCEPPANLLKHMATVQIVGEGGQPLKLSLANEPRLAPLGTVMIVGTVAQIDEAGTFVVNADRIYVKKG